MLARFTAFCSVSVTQLGHIKDSSLLFYMGFTCSSSMANNANLSQALWKLVLDLQMASHYDKLSLKISDVYGEIGAQYTFYAGPFLWILPSIVTVTMSVVFIRKGILGVVQKFLLATMAIDLAYTVVSAARDGILVLSNKHFGYIEYEYCHAILMSFNVQVLLQGTSIWLKAMMTMHQYLSIRFPQRLRILRINKVLLGLSFVHIAMITLVCLTYSSPALKTAKILQEFEEGSPLRVINSCIFVGMSNFERLNAESVGWLFMIYFLHLPAVVHIFLVVALLRLMIKQLHLVKLFSSHGNRFSKSVKYIVLMKITVCLGISFFLQELPMIILSLIHIYTQNHKVTNFHSTALSFQTISFSVGKTVDFVVYASLSPTFRSELKRISTGCCLKKTKWHKQVTNVSSVSSKRTSRRY